MTQRTIIAVQNADLLAALQAIAGPAGFQIQSAPDNVSAAKLAADLRMAAALKKLSPIFKWFGEDFGGGDAGVIAHLARFAEPELAARLKSTTAVGADAYDWTLNDAR